MMMISSIPTEENGHGQTHADMNYDLCEDLRFSSPIEKANSNSGGGTAALFQRVETNIYNITPVLKQIIVDSARPLDDPPKVLVRDDSHYVAEGRDSWSERYGRRKVVNMAGFNADTKHPYRPLGEPELDSRRLVLKAMNISAGGVTNDSSYSSRTGSSQGNRSRTNPASSLINTTSGAEDKGESDTIQKQQQKAANANINSPVYLTAIGKTPYRHSGYANIKSHLAESVERMRAVKSEINPPLQRKYNRKCARETVFDEAQFDTAVDVAFQESGWATRLARHQKITGDPEDFRVHTEILPGLAEFRMDKKQESDTEKGQETNGQRTQTTALTNDGISDIGDDDKAAAAATATPSTNIIPRRRTQQSPNKIGARFYPLPSKDTLVQWPHFSKRISRKAKEFIKIHDSFAERLSENLEKIASHRNDSFKETWTIVGDIFSEGLDGDTALKVQNEIHHRRNARSRELMEWAREWHFMKQKLEDDSELLNITEQNIWKQMKSWVDDGEPYGETEFIQLLKLVPVNDWSKNIMQTFIRFLKDKAFKLPERVFLDLTVRHTKELTSKRNGKSEESDSNQSQNQTEPSEEAALQQTIVEIK